MYNIEITGTVFQKTAEKIEKIVDVCIKNKIEITASLFMKKAEEIEKIIEVCNKNNIKITGSLFLRSALDIEKIVDVCIKNKIEITASLFMKKAEEIEKIIEVCKKNKIEIIGSLFMKTSSELNKSIEYVKNNYGSEYLKPLIINKKAEYLKEVFEYLNALGVLKYVVNSSSILTLTLTEIKERKEFIESIGEDIIDKRGKFNSIFGLSRKNYKNKLEEISINKQNK